MRIKKIKIIFKKQIIKRVISYSLLVAIVIYVYNNFYEIQQAVYKVTKSEGITGSYLAGDYANRNDNLESAYAIYSRGLEDNPNNPLLLKENYKLAISLGKIDEAVFYAKRSLIFDKDDMTAHLLIAMQHFKNKRYKEAEAVFLKMQEIEKQKSGSVDGILLPFFIIWAKVGEQNYIEATKLSDAMLDSYEVPSLFMNYQSAIINVLAGNNKRAKEEFDVVTKPSELPYHFVMVAGNFYERHNLPDKAKKLYLKYREDNPPINYFERDIARIEKGDMPLSLISSADDGLKEVLMEAVRVLFRNYNVRDALGYIQLVLYLDPDNDQAKILLASFYEQKEDFAAANRVYNSINGDSDFFWKVRVNMAENLYKLGKEDRAGKEFEEIAKRNPEDFSAILAYADLLRGDKEYGKAAKIYQDILSGLTMIKPQHWSLYFTLGICYERTKQWDKAEEALKHALKLRPGQPEVLNYLGYSWADRNKNLKEARDMIAQALEQRPGDPQIIDSLAWATYKLGDASTAVAMLESAVQVVPYDPVINLHLGDVYWEVGRKREAQFQWHRSIDYKNEEVDVEQLKERLAREE